MVKGTAPPQCWPPSMDTWMYALVTNMARFRDRNCATVDVACSFSLSSVLLTITQGGEAVTTKPVSGSNRASIVANTRHPAPTSTLSS